MSTTAANCGGNLTIDAGSTLNTTSNTLTISGNIIVSGTLSLGGNVIASGNWTVTGTQTNNSKTVTIGGSGLQTIGESITQYFEDGGYIISSSKGDKFKYKQSMIIQDDGVYVKEVYEHLNIFLFFKKNETYTYEKPLFRFPLPLSPGMEVGGRRMLRRCYQ
jgi:hypothetical protein